MTDELKVHRFKVTPMDEEGRCDALRIELDGKPLAMVKEMHIDMTADTPFPLVTLTMHAGIDLDLPTAEVTVEKPCGDDS
jgi:hypothetical protein